MSKAKNCKLQIFNCKLRSNRRSKEEAKEEAKKKHAGRMPAIRADETSATRTTAACSVASEIFFNL